MPQSSVDYASLRQSFKYLNRFMLLMWRLGMGGWVNFWPEMIGRIMVVTHTGRKSGRRLHTPVNYAMMDGEVYCTAGFGQVSDWYRNMLANPQVEVWLPNGVLRPNSWYGGVAREVHDPAQRIILLRQILKNSGRIVSSSFGYNPWAATDEELAETTRDYHVMHIHCTHALTGSGGPGELSGIWLAAAWVLLPLTILLMFRRKGNR
jgi:deazaflavin-dependent oxidoreductase (nitroreductase family)